MSDDQHEQHLPKARPLAELPIERVLERAEELARRWAIALVLARPLDGLAEVPLEELAREAPELCVQVLRALASDAELDSLIDGMRPRPRAGAPAEDPAARLQEISGAHSPHALVEAVEALRGVLWDALLEQLDASAFERTSTRAAADACDRLAFVCSCLLAASVGPPVGERSAAGAGALAGLGEARAVEQRFAAAQRAFEPAMARVERAIVAGAAPEQVDRGQRPRLLIIDELAPAVAERGEPTRATEPRREIEARDERGEHPHPPWIDAIARELDSYRRSGRPFSVLVIELRGSALARDPGSGRSALAEDVERVLSAELRQAARALTSGQLGSLREGSRPGSLAREGPGRFWLLAPDTDRSGAADLVRRLERAVARPASQRGGTVEVAIGSAVCPDDATDAVALAEHADLDLYAWRSSTGVPEQVHDAARQRRA